MSKRFGLLACLLLVALPRLTLGAVPAHQRWLAVSGVDFDPLADPRLAERLAHAPPERWRAIFSSDGTPPFSDYGSDTNFPLLESALEGMRNVDREPPVVIIAGGLISGRLRQRYDEELRTNDSAAYARFVDATMRFLAIEFREAFPHAQILPVLGVDDAACGSAQVTPSGAFLARTAASWGASVGAADPATFIAQFSTGGYYTQMLPAGGATAVVVNDVFWSPGYRNVCGDANAHPGADEMSWLTTTLHALSGKPVWELGAIPPGIDGDASLQAKPPSGVPFLSQQFAAAYVNALMAPGPVVQLALAGGTRKNAFRIIGPDPSRPRVAMLDLPAISPIAATNPSFTVLDVDGADARLQDAQYFVLDDLSALAKNARRPARWRREFDFDSIYGRGPIDATRLSAVQAAIFNDARVRRRYEEFYDGSSGRAPITEATWRFFWCADVALTATLYDACASPWIQHKLPPHPSPPPLATPSPSPAPSPSTVPLPGASP